jgi:hypothetical protein
MSYLYHERHIFHGDREGNKRKAAEAALVMLKKFLVHGAEGARSSER